jgi:hypothetical protein
MQDKHWDDMGMPSEDKMDEAKCDEKGLNKRKHGKEGPPLGCSLHASDFN